jgi:hypothetical protein
MDAETKKLFRVILLLPLLFAAAVIVYCVLAPDPNFPPSPAGP